MDTKQKVRMSIDISMTLLSIVLMGGTIMFPDDRIHQLLGMLLLALWICHTVLNRHWFCSLFKGKYPPYRILQIIVNCGISVCALLLMISGLMMAWFLPFSVGEAISFARTVHLVSSHWYYIFMCAHLGLHLAMIFSRLGLKGKSLGKRKVLLLKIILVLVCAYGIYAFIVRKIALYLFLRQLFFFFDLERGYILFAVDYLAILILIATASQYIGKALLYLQSKKNG